MKLQSKVFIGFSIVLTTIIGIGSIGYLGTQKVKKTFDKVIEETAVELNLLNKVNLLSKELEIYTLDKSLHSKLNGDSTQFNTNGFNTIIYLLDSTISEIEKIQSNIDTPDKNFINELKKLKQIVVSNSQSIIESIQNYESYNDFPQLQSNLKKSQKSLSLLISIHTKTRSKEALIKNIGANQSFNTTASDILITAIISIIILIILWTIYSRMITRIKKSEIESHNSLVEKVALLQEVHHRVKNNLQVIISLTSLQLYNLNGKDAETVLQTMQNRVKAMAFVNETIYENDTLKEIKYTEYLKKLTNHLIIRSWNLRETPTIHIEAKNINLGIDTAAPLGLLLNELISNTLKHAFDQSSKNMKIGIKIIQNGEKKYTLIYSDNGKGLPKNVSTDEPISLGLELITMLSEQINGYVSVDTSNGTKFTIPFEEVEAPKLN